MYDIAIAVGFLCATTVVLDHDVTVTRSRRFHVPVEADAEARKRVDSFRLWISEDNGKSWKRYGEMDAGGTRFTVVAPKDGHYWLAFQTAFKGGMLLPAKVDSAAVGIKVYVNAAGRTVIRKLEAVPDRQPDD